MDITLEAPAKAEVVDFADYARAALDDLGPAVAVAIGDDQIAIDALTASLTNVREHWKEVGADPDRYVFAGAIGHVINERAATGEPAATQLPLLGPACAVAYFGLDWTLEETSAGLQLSREAVGHHLAAARERGIAREPTKELRFDVRHQVRELIEKQPSPMVDVARIDRRYRRGLRRRTIQRAGVAVALAIGALVLLAQLVARPERLATEPPPTAVPPTATPIADVGTAGAVAGAIGNEPRPDLVPRPKLIATDGDGGFVGVRSPSPQNAQAIFTRSTDAETWGLASRWNLGPGVSISRFERSGRFFLAWIEGSAQTSDTVIGTVGISQDLIAWTVVELAIDDPAPFGLVYDIEIADVSVSGENILALARTTVEINFAALSLSEGYTCGQTVTQDEVSVKLCNDAELDVLSLSGIETLPEANRLFVSRGGLPFEETEVPFDNRAAVNLTTVNGMFAFTDESGLRFATSSDADSWKIITAGKPPFPVRAAATNPLGEIVGVGIGSAGQLALFHNNGQAANTVVRNLSELVGDIELGAQALVASGPSTWVVYLYEPEGRAWLLNSDNGIDWRVERWTAPSGDEPILLVGDNEALIQWIDDAGETFTLGVPLGS